MSSGDCGLRVKGYSKVLMLALVVLGLAGCSGGLKNVQTWDGPSADSDQIGILHAPANINVSSVNGKEMSRYLMEDLALDYELLPGENTVVFTHQTIWAKKTVVDNGESKVHVVKTEPQQVVINVKAGEEYTFAVAEPKNKREAEQQVAHFEAKVIDEQKRQVAVAKPYVAQRPQLPTLSSAPATAGAAAAGGAAAATASKPASTSSTTATSAPAAPVENGLPTLEGLKVLWERASAEDKKNFLRWAFE
ncbi:DUF2057 domain-containing protein [Marinobacter sp. BGYM27]|uniref:DUF2057 domain-containing protein n=1 Tax=unclassified Marinobacter TaxID=83889 RepID=UPI0021A8F675|nr:DUF2057 domain-containing protein [Marinobacter sp. BGYM27]MDG5500694.1 DUF2057 domain-containing protein [Marinobacter sp. BGYM27]